MTVEQIIEVVGVKFKSVPETQGCIGCAFYEGKYADCCEDVSCGFNIFVEVDPDTTTHQETPEQSTQPTFTIDEVVSVCSEYINKHYSVSVNLFHDVKFRQHLEKVSTPEYREYLRLKTLLDL